MTEDNIWWFGLGMFLGFVSSTFGVWLGIRDLKKKHNLP